jgi:hypothetical protein
VLGDVRHPELVGGIAPELALDQVSKGRHVIEVFR